MPDTVSERPGAPGVRIERIAGALGAFVHGIDAARLDDAGVATLRGAILDHLVVVLPDQAMDLDDLERLTDQLGGRGVTPYVEPVEGRPYVIRVIKEPGDQLNFANAWHSDLSYLAEPPSMTVLHAREVPPFGGDTIWANQYLAYETLPADVRARLLGLRGVHSAGPSYGTGGFLELTSELSSMAIRPSEEAHGTRTHPMVIRHPETGRSALFADPTYTVSIEGLPDGESRGLLPYLARHAVNENLTCRVRWRPGMLAIWDNRCTQHFAVNDYAGHRREMYRTSVVGGVPQAAEA